MRPGQIPWLVLATVAALSAGSAIAGLGAARKLTIACHVSQQAIACHWEAEFGVAGRSGGHAGKPACEPRELTGRDAVADRRALALGGHKPGLAQHLEVCGDGRLGDVEELGEVAGADSRLGSKALQNAPAHRVRKRAQNIDLIGHAPSISPSNDIV